MEETNGKGQVQEPDLVIYSIDQTSGQVQVPERSEAAAPPNRENIAGALLREVQQLTDKPVSRPGQEVRNQMAIETLPLPAGFSEAPPQVRDFANASVSREFHPAGDNDTTLVMYYRGNPTSTEAGQAFRHLLNQQPHTLSAQELQAISPTLGNLADPLAFDLRSARTATVGDRNVLVVDGQWRNSQTQFHGMMIDANGKGTVVQEVFFEANLQNYTRHINAVAQSLSRIRWKAR